MKVLSPRSLPLLVVGAITAALFASPRTLHAAQTWQLTVGAESPDMGRQALAFLPNEIWIHAGDSVTWTFASDEIHTLSLLAPGQSLPVSFAVGCPGFADPSTPAMYTGLACVTTPPLVKGQTFTVTFPTAGSFKFQCLVHFTMTGTIHVLSPGEILPHDQAFYDRQAAGQRQAILADIGEKTMSMGQGDGDQGDEVTVIPGPAHVTAGIGEVTSNPGGLRTGSLVRFVNGTITIHVGDTVEWGNHDPIEPHTITFGPDPADEFDPSANVSIDSDGALHVTLKSPSDTAHSGFLEQPLEDEPFVPQNPVVNAQNPATNIGNVALSNPTRFRATFLAPGTYNYRCVLHDNLGMLGKVIVVP